MKQITIHNLTTSTPQEVFDFVANHLLTQNQKSKDIDGSCRYRMSNGLMCAAGVLIPDADYTECLEHNDWSGEVISDAFPQTKSNHNVLIYDLQQIHDFIGVENWKEQLRKCAHNYHLNCNF